MQLRGGVCPVTAAGAPALPHAHFLSARRALVLRGVRAGLGGPPRVPSVTRSETESLMSVGLLPLSPQRRRSGGKGPRKPSCRSPAPWRSQKPPQSQGLGPRGITGSDLQSPGHRSASLPRSRSPRRRGFVPSSLKPESSGPASTVPGPSAPLALLGRPRAAVLCSAHGRVSPHPELSGAVSSGNHRGLWAQLIRPSCAFRPHPICGLRDPAPAQGRSLALGSRCSRRPPSWGCGGGVTNQAEQTVS